MSNQNYGVVDRIKLSGSFFLIAVCVLVNPHGTLKIMADKLGEIFRQ